MEDLSGQREVGVGAGRGEPPLLQPSLTSRIPEGFWMRFPKKSHPIHLSSRLGCTRGLGFGSSGKSQAGLGLQELSPTGNLLPQPKSGSCGGLGVASVAFPGL